jgi:hypothetical protein
MGYRIGGDHSSTPSAPHLHLSAPVPSVSPLLLLRNRSRTWGCLARRGATDEILDSRPQCAERPRMAAQVPSDAGTQLH